MCVIAIKPKGVRISTESVLLMWKSNSDGAGLAIVRKNKTYIMKGYMKIGDLLEDLNSFGNDEVVIHFRYATHGGVTPTLTHPFVLSNDVEESLKLTTVTKHPVLFHNGIIHNYGRPTVSDTLDFAQRVLSRLDTIDDVKQLLGSVTSKFALIHGGKVHTIGKFEKYKGLLVSNTYFTMDNHYGVSFPHRKIGYTSDYESRHTDNVTWRVDSFTKKQ